jgi:hypothetical protein
MLLASLFEWEEKLSVAAEWIEQAEKSSSRAPPSDLLAWS